MALSVGYTALMRTILLVLAAVAVFWILRSYWRRFALQRRGKSAPVKRGSQSLVRCDHCGVHIPEDQAIRRQERAFCSEEHARLGSDAD